MHLILPVLLLASFSPRGEATQVIKLNRHSSQAASPPLPQRKNGEVIIRNHDGNYKAEFAGADGLSSHSIKVRSPVTPSSITTASSTTSPITPSSTTISSSVTQSSTTSTMPASIESSLPLILTSKILYTIDITMNNMTFAVMVDTGSSDFWVATQNCSENCSGMTESVVLPNAQCQQYVRNYFDGGWVQGCMTNTNLEIGGFDLLNYTLLGVNNLSSAWQNDSQLFSGLWGLGQTDSALNNNPTPIDALYSAKEITQPIVGFYLAREGAPADSQIVIGDPTSLDEGTIPFNKTYNAMFNSTGQINGHYPIQIDSIDVYGQTPYNNGTTPITQSDLAGQSVVIDTGSNIISVPSQFINPIYGTLNNGSLASDLNGNPALPCNMTSNSTAVISFVLKGLSFPIQFQDIIGGPTPNNQSYCEGKIKSSNDTVTWILGDPFLVNVFHQINSQNASVTIYGLTG